MSIFTKAWAWLKNAFKYVETDGDKIAISVTEELKTAFSGQAVGFLAKIADGLVHSQVPTEIVTFVNANITKLLAVELAIQGLPATLTEADILAFEQAVLKAFGLVDDTSKLYTTLAAQIYGMLKAQVDSKTKLTFAVLVADVEEEYQNLLTDQAAA